MMEISSGDESAAMMLRQRYRWRALMTGHGRMHVPMNGGSDTRRDAREWWQEQCQAVRVPFVARSCQIEIGGFVPHSDRGWRFVVVGRTGQWMHWRRAKRVSRGPR